MVIIEKTKDGKKHNKRKEKEMKKSITVILVALGLYLLPSLAAAGTTTAYICAIQPVQNFAPFGEAGGAIMTIYSEPNCSGNNLGNVNYCSKGATDVRCPSLQVYLPTTSTMGATLEMFHSGGIDGTKFLFYTSPCTGGSTNTNCLAGFSTEYR